MLVKDKTWDGFDGIDEEYFEKLAENISLRPEIPEAIHRQIKSIKTIIKCCYYDYSLIGVIAHLATVSYEAALKLKYNSSDKPLVKNPTLKALIEWADSHNYLEEPKKIIDAIRGLRNAYAHQIDPIVPGPMGLSFAVRTIDHVNSLYDDRIDLRKERKRVETNINERFSKILENGLIFHGHGQRIIIFDVWLLLYNNFVSLPDYYISLYPIFEIIEDANYIEEGWPIIIKSKKCVIGETNDVEVSLDDGIFVGELVGQSNLEKYAQFKERFNKSKLPLSYITRLKPNEIRNKLYSELIYNSFTLPLNNPQT
jgi:hypothetical protein